MNYNSARLSDLGKRHVCGETSNFPASIRIEKYMVIVKDLREQVVLFIQKNQHKHMVLEQKS